MWGSNSFAAWLPHSYNCININIKYYPSLKAPSSIPSLIHMYSHSHVLLSLLCVLLHRAPPSCLPILALVLLSELFLLLTRYITGLPDCS